MDRLGVSIIDWWQEAGVDTIVDDLPRDWLAAPATMPATTSVAITAPLPATLPADLAAFRAYLTGSDEVPGPMAARMDATGDPASGTMIVVDMPEAGDRAAGRLLGGDAGELLDRMMAAMRLSRETAYLAPLAPARSASGRLDDVAAATLARLMRHHVALVRPRRLLIFGDVAVRALLGIGCAEARGRAHGFTYDSGEVPAIATFHPRFLVQTPARKAAAWADLKLFMAL